MATTPAAAKTPSPTATRIRAPFLRDMLMWMLSFLALPIAGFLGTAIVGRVDDIFSALVGGAVVGLIVGFAQALLSRGRLSLVSWPVASAVGLSVGLAVGTLAVGYQTSLGALALAGLVTGLIVGLVQTFALPATTRFRWLWLPVTAALWPLGWTVTTLIGVKVEEQIIVFGASGAFVYTLLAGLMLRFMMPQPVAKTSTPSLSARR
ncbi:hypothetical protein [uncultured Microbacterium sp.]|nr:hypothetical protein [uncultured Microbacterium sp.]